MDIVLATKVLSRLALSKDFELTVQDNYISTIKAKYIGIIDFGKNSKMGIKVYFIEEVQQDDVLRHNSQFNKDFVSKYYVKHKVFVTETLNNKLKKIVIINHRRSKWKTM